MKSRLGSIYDALCYADTPQGFNAGNFFDFWFRLHGRAYFFVFKRNLRVTDIQFAELRALITCHLRVVGEREGHLLKSYRPAFLSQDEFKIGLGALVDSFPPPLGDSVARYRAITDLYAEHLQRSIILEPLFGTCAVYLPEHLELDLRSICAEAGYVHSAGQLVYLKSLERASQSELFRSLRRHFERLGNQAARRRFIVYCHEDFSAYDRDWAPDLRNGLDDLKIHLEKFHLGEEHLVAVLEAMRREFRHDLTVAAVGHYRSERRTKGEKAPGSPPPTIWLLVDRGVGPLVHEPADRIYCACYEQQYVNCNPFHVFDENKPAWIAHTTAPHTLIAAMINIARPSLGARRSFILCDPFVGSGTSWLEGQKLPSVRLRCSDNNPVAELLLQDNQAVFCADARAIGRYAAAIRKMGEQHNGSRGGHRVWPRWMDRLLGFLDSAERREAVDGWNLVVADLRKRRLEDRLRFYVVLRVARRHAAAFRRGSLTEREAFGQELRELGRQLEELRLLRQKEEQRRAEGAVVCVGGNYSAGVSISRRWLQGQAKRDKGRSFTVLDVRRLNRRSCDVIVADPPYGFNTNEDAIGLARLYQDSMRAMILALRPGGHLIICLPERSRSGRPVPFFTQREMVVREVLLAAEGASRRVRGTASLLPSGPDLFRAPFYWESERALKRSILHFEFE